MIAGSALILEVFSGDVRHPYSATFAPGKPDDEYRTKLWISRWQYRAVAGLRVAHWLVRQ